MSEEIKDNKEEELKPEESSESDRELDEEDMYVYEAFIAEQGY